MMAMLKIFAVLLLFSVCNRGNAQNCSLSDLAVTQTLEQGNVYAVTVENQCICTQSNIKLACQGFASSMGLGDQAVIQPDGDGKLCSLNGAVGMGPEYAVKFRYTSSVEIDFKPVSSTIACS